MKLEDTIMFVMSPGVCTHVQIVPEVQELDELTRRKLAGDGEFLQVFPANFWLGWVN